MIAHLISVNWYVARHRTKSKVVNANKVGSSEVQDHPILSTDADMTNEGNQPRDERKRSPNYTTRKASSFWINFPQLPRVVVQHPLVLEGYSGIHYDLILRNQALIDWWWTMSHKIKKKSKFQGEGVVARKQNKLQKNQCWNLIDNINTGKRNRRLEVRQGTKT